MLLLAKLNLLLKNPNPGRNLLLIPLRPLIIFGTRLNLLLIILGLGRLNLLITLPRTLPLGLTILEPLA